jgi:hypothetical protein
MRFTICAGLALALSACGGSLQPAGLPEEALSAVATPQLTPGAPPLTPAISARPLASVTTALVSSATPPPAIIVRGATVVLPSSAAPSLAAPTSLPTPRLSPTLAPVLPLRIGAQLDPPMPRAGTEFVLRLTIADDGDRAAQGVYIATSGPWDRWTVLDVQPGGTFGRDANGWHIASPLLIPSRETRDVEIHIRADEATEEQLTFAVREAEPGELR